MPVPLTDIEAAARHNPYGIPPSTVLALCEALRIAVEGLGRYGEHDTACLSNAGDSHPCDCGYDDALAAVRELVDLGGDDGK